MFQVQLFLISGTDTNRWHLQSWHDQGSSWDLVQLQNRKTGPFRLTVATEAAMMSLLERASKQVGVQAACLQRTGRYFK